MAIIARDPNYSDLDLDFIAHPTTGDVVKKYGEDAIKRSIRNLIMTNFYDKPFRPGVGSNVTKLLFENSTPIVKNLISSAITEMVNNYEPRIRIRKIDVNFSETDNAYNISIFFTIVNTSQPVTINLLLERIR
jgi:phage baseplate assembly protein W